MLPQHLTFEVDAKYFSDKITMLACLGMGFVCEGRHISEHYHPWLSDYQAH